MCASGDGEFECVECVKCVCGIWVCGVHECVVASALSVYRCEKV